jgi:acetyltransferase-like isoleucine patch superfamily enzyme
MLFPRSISRTFLFSHRLWRRLQAKLFSLLAAGAFARFGSRSILEPPVRLLGEARVALGDRVYFGAGSWLQALPDGANCSVAISVGNGVSSAGGCVISAVRSVVIEEDVLLARNVYISDHIHKYTDTDLPVLAQGCDKIAPVRICRGAWLGQNVVVCPGTTIGRGAVIGANSVVNRSIPEFSVAAGAPARVVKTFAPSAAPAALELSRVDR